MHIQTGTTMERGQVDRRVCGDRTHGLLWLGGAQFRGTADEFDAVAEAASSLARELREARADAHQPTEKAA